MRPRLLGLAFMIVATAQAVAAISQREFQLMPADVAVFTGGNMMWSRKYG